MNRRKKKKLRKRLGVWHYRVFRTACKYYVKLTNKPFPIKWWVMRTAIDLARHPEKFNEPFRFQRFARSLTAQTVLKSDKTAEALEKTPAIAIVALEPNESRTNEIPEYFTIVNRYPEWLKNYLDHKRWKDGLNDDTYDESDVDILHLTLKGDGTVEQTPEEET